MLQKSYCNEEDSNVFVLNLGFYGIVNKFVTKNRLLSFFALDVFLYLLKITTAFEFKKVWLFIDK